MNIVISNKDCEEYGCPYCGCSYKWLKSGSSWSNLYCCGECQKDYNIVSDKLIEYVRIYQNIKDNHLEKIVSMYYDIDPKYYEHAKELCDKVIKHPRFGISKHELSIPDIRPADNNGDYCYDFGRVNTKEAGKRIEKMVNTLNKELCYQSFSCVMKYENPLWIRVRFDHPNSGQVVKLIKMIAENGNIITRELVLKAHYANVIDDIKSRKIGRK